ncbi:hypothetical protein PTSG_07659 [Salpingoeca rosetta]|uniref:Mediator of RNA polymerase II transcription subunit 1 n=1 Tax=Salpingoeca rosetta (strain ATCC 50818 / BSB-021) TaxID=946362 RepID=F2UHE5_SALR5|nr:uncharacterized protein PTSG_07659 [Salpingoeca rosetta]EGD76544.1 hypothetical protein PTSG_07659 [Salpingoeca rosetta]|eukprot:XP_004991458.1 hypothetical protein PTSG_07659 [Salpingoeca rosetta]
MDVRSEDAATATTAVTGNSQQEPEPVQQPAQQQEQQREETLGLLTHAYVRHGWKVVRPRRLSRAMLDAVCTSLGMDVTGEVSEGSLFISHPAFYLEVHVDPKTHFVTKVDIGHDVQDAVEEPLLLFFLANEGFQGFGSYLRPVTQFYDSLRIHITDDGALEEARRQLYAALTNLRQYVDREACSLSAATAAIPLTNAAAINSATGSGTSDGTGDNNNSSSSSSNRSKSNNARHTPASNMRAGVAQLRSLISTGLGLTTTRFTDFRTFGPALLWYLSPQQQSILHHPRIALSRTGVEKQLPECACVCLVGTRCVAADDTWGFACTNLATQDGSKTPFPAQHFLRLTKPVIVPSHLVSDLAAVAKLDESVLRTKLPSQPILPQATPTQQQHVVGHYFVSIHADESTTSSTGAVVHELPFSSPEQLPPLLQILRQSVAFCALLKSAVTPSSLVQGFPKRSVKMTLGTVGSVLTLKPQDPATNRQPSVTLEVRRDGAVDCTSETTAVPATLSEVASAHLSIPHILASVLTQSEETSLQHQHQQSGDDGTIAASTARAKRTAAEADASV